MKKILSLLALVAVCFFIFLEQTAAVREESEQNAFPKGKITYLISN